MQEQEPWLELDSGPEKGDVAQAEREFAQLYYDLFVTNPTGAKLLAHWDETILRRPTAVNSPVQQYAWDEGQRAFIRGIKGQILLAQQQRKTK